MDFRVEYFVDFNTDVLIQSYNKEIGKHSIDCSPINNTLELLRKFKEVLIKLKELPEGFIDSQIIKIDRIDIDTFNGEILIQCISVEKKFQEDNKTYNFVTRYSNHPNDSRAIYKFKFVDTFGYDRQMEILYGACDTIDDVLALLLKTIEIIEDLKNLEIKIITFNIDVKSFEAHIQYALPKV